MARALEETDGSSLSTTRIAIAHAASGKTTPTEVAPGELQLLAPAASPGLLTLAASGKQVSQLELANRNSSGEVYLVWQLTDVLITSYQVVQQTESGSGAKIRFALEYGDLQIKRLVGGHLVEDSPGFGPSNVPGGWSIANFAGPAAQVAVAAESVLWPAQAPEGWTRISGRT